MELGGYEGGYKVGYEVGYGSCMFFPRLSPRPLILDRPLPPAPPQGDCSGEYRAMLLALAKE